MANNIPSVYGLNRTLWATIVESGIIPDTSNYNGLVPIIPTQEEPQFLSAMESQNGIGSFPYIVYQWYTNSIGPDSWFKQTDTITYTIYSADQKALRGLIRLVTDLFKRYDDSAAVVNQYIATAYPDLTSEYRNYHYNYISVVAATGGNPANAEDAPNRAAITLRVNYVDYRNDESLTVPGIPQ